MTSRAFGSEKAKRPHLVTDGKGGVAGEVGDLRSDVENGFTSVEAEIDAVSMRAPVRLATAAALNACTAAGTGVGKTLTQNAAAIENIDSVAVVVGDRILVKDQVAGKDNGIYTVTTVGTGAIKQVLTRATDADDSASVNAGMMTFVSEGTVNSNLVFGLTTNDPITVDTTALTFAQLSAVGHAALHITGASDEIDGDQIDIDWAPTNYTPTVAPAEVTSLDHLTAHLAGIDAGVLHAASHDTSGADEVDGDHLDIDFTPSYYTPSTAPAEASDVDHLAAHLSGIDTEMLGMAQSQGASASAVIIQAGQPVAAETITIGADVYEADGAGANINFVIAGGAEATMDNLLAAAVANGTENLFWDKLSATTLRIRAADAPQGTIIGADPNILLANTLTNYTFNVGAVNLNTLAGKAAAQQVMAATTLTITAAMITATLARVSFPFTPTSLQVTVFDSTGALKMACTDTFVITGDDVVITLAGGGGDLANTDVVHIVAYA